MSFEVVVRSELTKRLNKRIFPLAFVSSLVFWLLISPRWTITYTPFVTVALGIAPAVVLRKSRLTLTRKVATSPSQSFTLFKSFSAAFSAYLASAALLAFTFGGTNVFVLSRKHPYYLNPHLIVGVIAQVMVSLVYLSRVILLDRFSFHYPRSESPRTPFSPLALLTNLFTSTIIAGLALAATMPVVLLLLPLASRTIPLVKHFIGHAGWSLRFLRGARMGTVFTLALGTVWTWESIDAIMDVVLAKPFSVSHHLAPSQTLPSLISGLSCSEPTFRYFAYKELVNLSTQEDKHFSQLRTQLYTTLSTSSSSSSSGLPPPGLGASLSASSLRFSTSSGFTNTKQGTHWTPLLRTLLLQLGNAYQLIADRGIPRPAAPSAAAQPTTGKSSGLPEHLLGSELKLRRDGSIFKRGGSALNQSFGASSSAVAAVAEELDTSLPALPEIFRSSTSQLASAAAEKSSAIVAAPVAAAEKAKGSVLAYLPTAGLTNAVSRVIPAPVKTQYSSISDWWCKPRKGKQVERMVSTWEIDVFAVQSLAALTAHSFTQDTYGIVQRDIPKILESLCVLLQKVQEVKKEYGLPSSSDEDPSVSSQSVLGEFREGLRGLSALEDELKGGISLIVHTFGDTLWKSYKFPDRTANVLRAWVGRS